jgi:uncharacterized membrane protein YoaK (UPF0700 family)
MASDVKQLNPKWILAGGCCLAFLSAAVNAGFLIQLGTSVSHLTGDATNAAVNLVHRLGNDLLLSETLRNSNPLQDTLFKLLAAIVGFVSGASLAGYFIHHPILEISRPYGRSVSFIGICLIISHFTMYSVPSFSVFTTAVACGLQNALATHYRGIILRTTHITGLLTDLGSNLGMKIRGHQIPIWKISAPFFLVLSFFAGAFFGTVLVVILNLPFLLILALLYLSGGIGWSIYKRVVLHYDHPST